MFSPLVKSQNSSNVNATVLSENKTGGEDGSTSNDFRRVQNNIISQEERAKALYSASADDLEIVCCFLELYQIIESPINILKPVVERILSTQASQLSSVRFYCQIIVIGCIIE